MSDPGDAHARDGESSEAVHTYRCPVCGHSDGVSFMGAEVLQIQCSHCAAKLELRLRSEDKEHVSVHVDTGD